MFTTTSSVLVNITHVPQLQDQKHEALGSRVERTFPVLTQVPGHQVGIVEILHSQSDDVDKFLDDLHELHRPRIDLNKGGEKKDPFDVMYPGKTEDQEVMGIFQKQIMKIQ